MFHAVIKENRRWTGEVKAEMPSGRTLALEILATSNRNADGETAGLVFSISDLSDRRRAEAAMRESERQRVMLESLGAACHHLGQPATVLMVNLGMIRAKVGGDDPVLSEMIDGCMVAIRRLGDTLHKLNCVNEYRTTSYMSDVDESSTSSRILDI
jgi:PAS domain-containing protein